MIISIRHWLLEGWTAGETHYGSGSSTGLANTDASANIKASAISDIVATATTTLSGLKIVYGQADIVGTATVDDLNANVVQTGSASLQASAYTTLESNVIYSVSGSVEGYASTWCYGINAKDTLGEATGTANTTLNANYITYISNTIIGTTDTTASAVIKKFASADIQAQGETTLTAKAILTTSVSISGVCLTTCLGARFIESPPINILGTAITEAIGEYGLGALESIYLEQNGRWTFVSQYNRQLYLSNSKIKIGNPNAKFIKFKTDRLYLEP